MSGFIRVRFNTMAHETLGEEWKWRVILENAGEFQELLVKKLYINVPSFSCTDELPAVGLKHHIACYGVLTVTDGVGTIDSLR